VIEATLSIAPCRDARKALAKVQEKNWVFPTPEHQLPVLDLVTVAYLPNEKDIILDRIQYAVNELVYPIDRIRINIVYNTPVQIEPLESEMQKMAAKYSHLRIIKVPGSTSKADNLNYFFTLNTGSDVIAVFDCDHYPHPCGPRWAAERFMSDKTIDIVQGRCVIFNSKASLLSAMIAVEFDKIYAVSHPGRAAAWNFGLFTGSNGYWRSTLLRDLRMRGEMLTEDIDSSLRAVSRGANTVHDMNVVSYELAPTTLKSFWNQRLRW
jgi:cellulose synthase/poly-beta-1,6-N-acetylglucosamine synthase-like glycosyltransferase